MPSRRSPSARSSKSRVASRWRPCGRWPIPAWTSSASGGSPTVRRRWTCRWSSMSADEVIVARLHGGGWVSGEALARELGVSRSAVGKHVAALRERGFDIEARAHRGYRLRAMPDSLEPAVVRPLLETRWAGQKLEWHERCGSTNDLAAERARAGAPHGLCVVAEAQERGRGRVGRQWFSPSRKNVYL